MIFILFKAYFYKYNKLSTMIAESKLPILGHPFLDGRQQAPV